MCHNGMETILNRLSVYTTTLISVLRFISDSNDNATVSKVIRYICWIAFHNDIFLVSKLNGVISMKLVFI